MTKKTTSPKSETVVKRPVDKYFEQMDSNLGSGNKVLFALFLAFAFFGIMGLIWMIPFPQFEFLVNLKMHTFLNWGSFFIAIAIYIYLRLAPTLSYAVLFSIAIMSFFIVQLEYVERDGGPTVVLICSIVGSIGLLGLFFVGIQTKNFNGKRFLQLLSLGPIWLWSKVFEKLKINY